MGSLLRFKVAGDAIARCWRERSGLALVPATGVASGVVRKRLIKLGLATCVLCRAKC